jgi:hypothetical protein
MTRIEESRSPKGAAVFVERNETMNEKKRNCSPGRVELRVVLVPT